MAQMSFPGSFLGGRESTGCKFHFLVAPGVEQSSHRVILIDFNKPNVARCINSYTYSYTYSYRANAGGLSSQLNIVLLLVDPLGCDPV